MSVHTWKDSFALEPEARLSDVQPNQGRTTTRLIEANDAHTSRWFVEENHWWTYCIDTFSSKPHWEFQEWDDLAWQSVARDEVKWTHVSSTIESKAIPLGQWWQDIPNVELLGIGVWGSKTPSELEHIHNKQQYKPCCLSNTGTMLQSNFAWNSHTYQSRVPSILSETKAYNSG